MLGNMISLFKARKDPALAKQIASEKTELTKRTAGLGQLGTPQKPAPSNDSQT